MSPSVCNGDAYSVKLLTLCSEIIKKVSLTTSNPKTKDLKNI